MRLRTAVGSIIPLYPLIINPVYHHDIPTISCSRCIPSMVGKTIHPTKQSWTVIHFDLDLVIGVKKYVYIYIYHMYTGLSYERC